MIILRNLQKLHHIISQFMKSCDDLLVAKTGGKADKRYMLKVPAFAQANLNHLKKEIKHYNYVFHSDDVLITASPLHQYKLVVVPALKQCLKISDAVRTACAVGLVQSLNREADEADTVVWVDRMKKLSALHKDVQIKLKNWMFL